MTTLTQRVAYETDVTDEQWLWIQPYLRRGPGSGRPTTVDLREVCNALLYWVRAGCPWRLLPHDFPNWTTVRYYFDKWTADGTFEQINRSLGRELREEAGRAPAPTGAILDSQSVKTTEAGGERGYDGGKG